MTWPGSYVAASSVCFPFPFPFPFPFTLALALDGKAVELEYLGGVGFKLQGGLDNLVVQVGVDESAEFDVVGVGCGVYSERGENLWFDGNGLNGFLGELIEP